MSFRQPFPTLLHGRPGDRRPLPARLRVRLRLQQPRHPRPQGVQFGGRDELRHPGGQGLPAASSPASRVSTASASSVSGSPAQPQRRVRSLSSALKVTPWSMPYSSPPGPGSRWPPLRSPLLITASSTASRRSRGSSACTSSAVLPFPTSAWPTAFQPSPGSSPSTRASSSGVSSPGPGPSIQSWHMPCPYGPSRSTVGGTRSQPVAREISYAATSRCASVPSGKSQSGCSPATGL